MLHGRGPSVETLSIEAELTRLHLQVNGFNQTKTLLTNEIESLARKQETLSREIRPSPIGELRKIAVPKDHQDLIFVRLSF